MLFIWGTVKYGVSKIQRFQWIQILGVTQSITKFTRVINVPFSPAHLERSLAVHFLIETYLGKAPISFLKNV